MYDALNFVFVSVKKELLKVEMSIPKLHKHHTEVKKKLQATRFELLDYQNLVNEVC